MNSFIVKEPAQWGDGNLVLTNFPKTGRHWSWIEKIPRCWVEKCAVNYDLTDNEGYIDMIVHTPGGIWKDLVFDMRIPFNDKIVEKISEIMNSKHPKTFDILLK